MELAEVYTTFKKSLYRYIYVKIRHKEDAEDILQNVFVKMTTNIDTLSDKEKVQNWLYRITRNTIIDYYRARANKQKTIELHASLPDELTDDLTDDAGKDLDKCLNGFITQLPEEYRSIIVDSELKEIPQKELAVKYNLPYPTLRSRVQRGRERLHKLMVNCCIIETDSRGNILEARRKSNSGESCEACY